MDKEKMQAYSNRLCPLDGKDTNFSNSSTLYTTRPEGVGTRKVMKLTGSLEIIEGTDSGMCELSHNSPSNSRPPSNFSSRCWSRGSVGSVPPRTDSSISRKVNTPTKQVTLQAVRRKEESSEPFVDHVDWEALSLNTNHRKTWEKAETGSETESEPNKKHAHNDRFRQEPELERSQHATKLRLPQPGKSEEEDMLKHSSSHKVRTLHEKAAKQEMDLKDKGDKHEKDDSDDDDDDDDSSSSDEVEEKRRAPNELLMEFVDCLMRKDYKNASKLCKMILLYEPENPEALKFQPLIEEKIAIDAEAEKEAAEDSDENEEGDSDEDSSDDNTDTDSEEDSDEEDDETSSQYTESKVDDGQTGPLQLHHPDSEKDSGTKN